MNRKLPSRVERRAVGALVSLLFKRDRSGGPWRVPQHLPHEEVHFEGNSGANLSGRYFHRDNEAAASRGVVVLVHPDRRYAQHWFVREGWVDLLTAAGFEVLTFDLTGYGQSQGPASYYHEDVAAAARFAARWSGGLPTHVIGVSIGAFAASNAAPLLDGVQSLTLESPYPSFKDWYTHGPTTPLERGIGRLGTGMLGILFRRSVRATSPAINMPDAAPQRILVVATTSDQVTPDHLSQRVAQLGPADRTSYLAVAGAAHLEILQHSRQYRQALLQHLGLDAAQAALHAASQRAVANAEAPTAAAPTMHKSGELREAVAV